MKAAEWGDGGRLDLTPGCSRSGQVRLALTGGRISTKPSVNRFVFPPSSTAVAEVLDRQTPVWLVAVGVATILVKFRPRRRARYPGRRSEANPCPARPWRPGPRCAPILRRGRCSNSLRQSAAINPAGSKAEHDLKIDPAVSASRGAEASARQRIRFAEDR